MNPRVLRAHLVDALPSEIRRAILENETLSSELLLVGERRVQIGDLDGPEATLLDAGRRAVVGGLRTEPDGFGGRLAVEPEEIGALLVVRNANGSETRATVAEFGLFSQSEPRRRIALARLRGGLAPYSHALHRISEVALERVLTSDEVAEVLHVRERAIPRWAHAVRQGAENGSLSVNALLPPDLEFLAMAYAPLPVAETESDFRARWREHLLTLVREDVTSGLVVLLRTAFAGVIDIPALLREVGNEELWPAIERCENSGDPFSLLGVLEVCSDRSQEWRYSRLARATADLLLRDEVPRPDGSESYSRVEVLLEFVRNRIGSLKGAPRQPRYWLELVAWMHSLTVTAALDGLGIDTDDLRSVCQVNLSGTGQLLKSLQVCGSPASAHAKWTAERLRAWAFRRLRELGERADGSSTVIQAVALNSREEELVEAGRFANVLLPGPLPELDDLDVDSEMLPPEVREWIEKASAEERLERCSFASYFFEIPPDLREWARVGIEVAGRSEQAASKRLEILSHAAVLAAGWRDRNLADEIVSQACKLAAGVETSGEVFSLVIVAILAAGWVLDESKRMVWLGERMDDLARSIAVGRPSAMLGKRLQQLRNVAGFDSGFLGRALARASAGSAESASVLG